MATDLYRPSARRSGDRDNDDPSSKSSDATVSSAPTALEVASGLLSAITRLSSSRDVVGRWNFTARGIEKNAVLLAGLQFRHPITRLTAPNVSPLWLDFPAVGPNAPSTRILIVDASGGRSSEIEELNPSSISGPLSGSDAEVIALATSARSGPEIAVPFDEDDD